MVGAEDVVRALKENTGQTEKLEKRVKKLSDEAAKGTKEAEREEAAVAEALEERTATNEEKPELEIVSPPDEKITISLLQLKNPGVLVKFRVLGGDKENYDVKVSLHSGLKGRNLLTENIRKNYFRAFQLTIKDFSKESGLSKLVHQSNDYELEFRILGTNIFETRTIRVVADILPTEPLPSPEPEEEKIAEEVEAAVPTTPSKEYHIVQKIKEAREQAELVEAIKQRRVAMYTSIMEYFWNRVKEERGIIENQIKKYLEKSDNKQLSNEEYEKLFDRPFETALQQTARYVMTRTEEFREVDMDFDDVKNFLSEFEHVCRNSASGLYYYNFHYKSLKGKTDVPRAYLSETRTNILNAVLGALQDEAESRRISEAVFKNADAYAKNFYDLQKQLDTRLRSKLERGYNQYVRGYGEKAVIRTPWGISKSVYQQGPLYEGSWQAGVRDSAIGKLKRKKEDLLAPGRRPEEETGIEKEIEEEIKELRLEEAGKRGQPEETKEEVVSEDTTKPDISMEIQSTSSAIEQIKQQLKADGTFDQDVFDELVKPLRESIESNRKKQTTV